MSDLEEFIENVIRGSEDKQQVKNLAIKIDRVGTKVIDFLEDTSKRLKSLYRKIDGTEEKFDSIVEDLASIPVETIQIGPLKLFGGSKMVASTPTIPASTPQNLPTTPSGPSLGGAPSGPSLGGAPSGPSLGGAPSGPNLGGSPSGPNLGGAPSGPNLGGSPSGPNLGGSPSGPNLGGGLVSGGALQDAISSLSKAPPKEPTPSAAPSLGGGGMVSQGALQNALANLKKAPPKEEKPKSSSPMAGGGMVSQDALQSALANLKKAPATEDKSKVTKKEEEEDEEDTTNIEELSAEQLKQQLQDKLKAAFK